MLPSRTYMLNLRLPIRDLMAYIFPLKPVGMNVFGNLFLEECRKGVGHALPGKIDLDIHAGMLRRKLPELLEQPTNK